MPFLTEEQVTQLAPDAASLRAGRTLAASNWLTFAASDRAAWGEIQGSGSAPYRTQTDLLSPAFNCTCPSRKFPCKHGLGLLFRLARNPSQTPTEEPAWVQDWMDRRASRAVPKTAPPPPETADKQTRDREKRQLDRLRKVQAGVADLDRWLRDLVRGGLLTLPDKGPRFFDHAAARLVDAQVPGLANLVREFNALPFAEPKTWQPRALAQVAKIFLATEAVQRLDALPDLLRDDVRNLVGWPRSPKELLENPAAETLADDWLAVGRLTEIQDGLTVQRTFLLGQRTHRFALDLQFAPQNGAIETPLVPGLEARAELAFFPSNWPLRAVVKTHDGNHPAAPCPAEPLPDWLASQQHLAETLARWPWADDVPQVVDALQPVPTPAGAWLRDATGRALPLHPSFGEDVLLRLLALGGGQPLPMALLRSGEWARPLGVWLSTRYLLL